MTCMVRLLASPALPRADCIIHGESREPDETARVDASDPVALSCQRPPQKIPPGRHLRVTPHGDPNSYRFPKSRANGGRAGPRLAGVSSQGSMT